MDWAVGAWWESVRGFFTPATLFLVVNLVIGTIALTSRSHQRRRRDRGTGYDGGHQEDRYYQDQQHEHEHEQQYVPAPPAPLERTSSVMDRIRSFGLYRFRSGDFPPEYGAPTADSQGEVSGPANGDGHYYARSRSEPANVREKKRAAPSRMKKSSSEARKAEVAPTPARAAVQADVVVEDKEDVLPAMADDFTGNFPQPPATSRSHAMEEEEEVYHQEEYVPPLRPAPLARTSSVLDRLRSFSLYRFRPGDLAPEQDDDAGDTPAQAAAHHARTRSEPAGEQSKKPAQEEEEEPESVDARADSFINSFRQQLHLQRLNSLLNYKETLNGGGATK